MKKLFYIFAAVLLCLTAAAQEKQKITLYDFGGGTQIVSEKVKSVVEKELINNSNFEVMTKKEVLTEAMKDEMFFIEDSNVAKELEGTDLIFTGRISLNKGEDAQKGGMDFSYRVINVKNSKIVYTDTIAFKDNKINEEFRKAFKKSLYKVFPLEAKIIKNDGNAVYINLGSLNGISVGDTMSLYRIVEEIKDIETGKILGHKKEKAGIIEITSVDSNYSTGKVNERISSFSVGDLAVMDIIDEPQKKPAAAKARVEEAFEKIEKPREDKKKKETVRIKIANLEKVDLPGSALLIAKNNDKLALDARLWLFGLGYDEDKGANYSFKVAMPLFIVKAGYMYKEEIGEKNKAKYISWIIQKDFEEIPISICTEFKTIKESGGESSVFGLGFETTKRLAESLAFGAEIQKNMKGSYLVEDLLTAKVDLSFSQNFTLGFGKTFGKSNSFYGRIEFSE